MLILLNYGLKLLKRRWYTYTFHVNPLTHLDALSSKTFYSTNYYFLCNTYCYSLWVNQVFIKFILPALKKKIRRYRHNFGSLTYIILEIYRKPRFACISSACMCIPKIWITIAAIFLINCQIYFVELLKNNQLYSYGW